MRELLLSPSRGRMRFAYDDAGIDGAALTITRGSLGLSPTELAEEIRAYRRTFSAGSETALREGRRR